MSEASGNYRSPIWRQIHFDRNEKKDRSFAKEGFETLCDAGTRFSYEEDL